MEFSYRYFGNSQVDDSVDNTDMSFAPDTLRDPTFFVGKLAQPLLFRGGDVRLARRRDVGSPLSTQR